MKRAATAYVLTAVRTRVEMRVEMEPLLHGFTVEAVEEGGGEDTACTVFFIDAAVSMEAQ